MISQAMPATVMARDARAAAAHYGAEVCGAVVYNRIAHAEPATAGRLIFHHGPESPDRIRDGLARQRGVERCRCSVTSPRRTQSEP